MLYEVITVQGDLEALGKMPGVVRFDPDGPSLTRITVRDNEQWNKYLAGVDIHVVKSRALELEEILRLWIEGHKPEELLV